MTISTFYDEAQVSLIHPNWDFVNFYLFSQMLTFGIALYNVTELLQKYMLNA